ncbi:MAG: mechanosensitive ion channel domain-containing protein [Xanthobacteraceae bacterium]
MGNIDWQHLDFTAGLKTAAILLVALTAVVVVNSVLQTRVRALATRFKWNFHILQIVRRAVTAVLVILALFLLLDVWGVGLTGLWTLVVGSVTVIGVGFLATWAMVSNVTANFFIAIWRPFFLGDTVEVLPENLKGRVVEINLMFTVLREEGGAAVMVPNNLFFQKMFRVIDTSQRTLFEETETMRRQRESGDS